jgi:hypothetical protein
MDQDSEYVSFEEASVPMLELYTPRPGQKERQEMLQS